MSFSNDDAPLEPPVADPWAAFGVGFSPRPAPWRAILPTWPIVEREKWGRAAERNEHDGHDWHEAERLAFEEVNGGPIRHDQLRTAGEHAAREAARDRGLDAAWAADGYDSLPAAAFREAARDEVGRASHAKAVKGRPSP